MRSHADAHDEIRQAEERLRAAMLASDVDALDALIDDRLLFVGPDGGVYRKADDLELHRSGAERLSRVELEEVLIESREAAAVTVVVARVAGVFKGEAFAGRYRYLRTWLRGERGWQVVGGSVCAMTES